MSTRSTRKRMAATPKVEKKNEMEITDDDVETFARLTGGPKAARTFREIREERKALTPEFEQEIYDIIQEPGFLSGRNPKNLAKLMPTGVKELDALEAHPAKRRRVTTDKQVEKDVIDILSDPSFLDGGKRHNKKGKSQKKRAGKKGKTQKKRAVKKGKTQKKRA